MEEEEEEKYYYYYYYGQICQKKPNMVEIIQKYWPL
jgi:hypothetical protein